MSFTIEIARSFLSGPLADRPLASVGRYWYLAEDEDDGTLYKSDGATWRQVAAGVSGGGGGVPTSRTLTAGAGLSGGGDLTADRSFAVNVDGTTLEIPVDTLQVKSGVFDAAGAAAAAQAASQPLDGDLTAIAGLDSSTSGAIASDGAGWIKKTYAQFKTALSLVKADVGLGSVDNTADAAKNVATAAALTTARNIDGQSFNGTADITVIAPGTHAATSKTTPVDNDELPLVDSAASNVLKKLTWANLKATLKAYTDTLYDSTGAAAAAQAASQPLDSDLTAIAALAPTNDDIVQRKAGAWTNRSIAQVLADLAVPGTTFQPLDSDLTAIAALSTTSFGRGLLALADQAALLSAAGAQASDSDLTDIAALTPTNDDVVQRKSGAWTNRSLAQLISDLAGLGTTFQPLDSDLTSIAALATTSFGRSLLTQATSAAARTTLGVRSGIPQSFLPTAIAECMHRALCQINGGLLSTGRLSSVSIPVLGGDVISSVSFCSATTALSAQTNWWFALVDSAFSVIRQSRDQLTGLWAANTLKTLTCDEVPVTAGSRSGTTTVTLTFPTLSVALSTLFAIGDSIVVSNANVAAYNGTFTVATVSSTQITYVCGGSATDSLAAPFPTVQPAAGKRAYTVPADGLVYAVIMAKGTVPTLASANMLPTPALLVPILCSSGNTSLTGTCPSPITTGTGASIIPWAAVS